MLNLNYPMTDETRGKVSGIITLITSITSMMLESAREIPNLADRRVIMEMLRDLLIICNTEGFALISPDATQKQAYDFMFTMNDRPHAIMLELDKAWEILGYEFTNEMGMTPAVALRTVISL